MKQKIFTLSCSTLLLLSISCNDSSRSYSDTNEIYSEVEYYETESPGYEDGTYCAEVEYYNPSTGTRNSYDLDVDVEGGELTVIHWPNGGWLDNTHFSTEDITSGECEFTSDRGYRYTVSLRELGGCGYTDDYRIRRDVNNDVEATTCPECGDEKDKYDKYCYYCTRNVEDQDENTCSRCGTYEYGVSGGLCSNCKQQDE